MREYYITSSTIDQIKVVKDKSDCDLVHSEDVYVLPQAIIDWADKVNEDFMEVQMYLISLLEKDRELSDLKSKVKEFEQDAKDREHHEDVIELSKRQNNKETEDE